MERILLVDDEINVLKALKRILRSRYKVITASSGGEALEIIEREDVFPAIISDMRMPEMSGIDFFAKVSLISPGTSKILLTGYADLDKVIESINRGNIFRFLQKPWKNEDIIHVLDEGITKFRSHQKLKNKSVTDGLTGLSNHNSIIQLLERRMIEIRAERMQLFVLMLDIDFFKKVNDKFGHQCGDNVLVKVADTIKRSCRKSDDVGRYGGEEFMVVFRDVSAVNALIIAERIRSGVASLVFEQQDLKVTISGGIKVLKGENSLEMIDAADKLLYRAKGEGRNRIISGFE